jgi:soluble lytic murein transglycosylase
MLVKREKNFQRVSRKSHKSMVDGGSVDWPPSGAKSFEEVLDRQVYKESRGNPLAVSPRGARGLAQIMPDTEGYLMERGLIPEGFDAFNPEHSRQAQQAYMDNLMNRDWNKGSEEIKIAKALSAYNFGPTATVRVLNKAKEKGTDIYNSLDWLEDLPLETRDYISKVLGYNEKFDGEYGGYILRAENK